MINSSYSNYSFDRSVLPVPGKDKMSFCQDDDSINSVFDSLNSLVKATTKTAAVVLIILALLSMIPMGYMDLIGWRSLRKRVFTLTRALQRTDKNLDPIDSFQTATSPWVHYFGIFITRPIRSVRNQSIIRWLIAYITYPSSLVVLSLAVASVASAIIQSSILSKLEAQSPALALSVGNLVNTVVSTVQDKGDEWANGTNDALALTETDINDNLFEWVLDATSSVNNTLNTFVDEMMSTLNDVFGDTPLYDPIVDVLNCLLLLKIKGVQSGLTWAHDNAHITLPRVNETLITDSLLSIDSNNSSNSSNSTDVTDAAISDLMNDTSSTVLAALQRAESAYRSGINLEFYFAGALFAVWVIIVLIGIGCVASVKYQEYKQRKMRIAQERQRDLLLTNPNITLDATNFQHLMVRPRPVNINECVGPRSATNAGPNLEQPGPTFRRRSVGADSSSSASEDEIFYADEKGLDKR